MEGQMTISDYIFSQGMKNEQDTSEEYEQFVDKFKPKKTTDDCFTPPAVYDVVCDFVEQRYGVSRRDFVRPFFPGGDYENYNYPEGCIVVDNPPFSLSAKILDFYIKHNIKFFLFAKLLTSISTCATRNLSIIYISTSIIFENGANVDTCFITNMDEEPVIEAISELSNKIAEVNKKEIKQLPKLRWPDELVTGAMLKQNQLDFKFYLKDAHFVRYIGLDKKCAFGGGLIVRSDIAQQLKQAQAQAQAQAQKTQIIEFTDEEKEILRKLNEREKTTT